MPNEVADPAGQCIREALVLSENLFPIGVSIIQRRHIHGEIRLP